MIDLIDNIKNNILPSELLEIIFKNLTKSEKKECLFVCSAWYGAAKIQFYKHVKIEGEEQIKRFLHCLHISDIGLYVQHLSITDIPVKKPRDLPPIYTPHDTSLLFGSCPNITCVDINRMNPYYVLRTLGQNNIRLVKLQEIRIWWNTCPKISSAVKRAYFVANFLHKNSIRFMHLPITKSINQWPDRINKADYFSNFPVLEHYSITQEMTRINQTLIDEVEAMLTSFRF